MADINPNVSTAETPVTETIEVAGGDTAVSFDDFEAVDRFHKEQDKAERKAAKAAPAAPAKKEARPAKAGPVADKEEGEADKQEEDDVAANDDDSTEKDASKQEKPRPIKMKDGDKEVEVDLGAKLPVVVNGKPVEVSLEELRNNYSGKVAWSERFSKLSNREQTFERSREIMNREVKELVEYSKTDGIAAMMKMAEIAGQDPLEWRKGFLENVLPGIAQYLELSDDERKIAELEFENKFRSQRDESQKKSAAEERGFTEFKSQVESLQQTHQIDSETFASTYFELERLQKTGDLNTKEITPQMVVDVVRNERLHDKLESLFSELKISDEKELDSAFKHMVDVWKKHPELKLDDLSEIARDVFGTRKAATLSRKVVQAKGPAARKVASAPKNPGHEALTFDDL